MITCAFNIAIWRKIKHRRVASQQQNRETQNVRLTETLMFASILALVCWPPFLFVSGLRYLGTTMSIRYYFIALILVGLILIVRKVFIFFTNLQCLIIDEADRILEIGF